MADRIPMMPPKVFWDVIEASKNPGEDEFLQALHRQLVTLPLDEIVGFDARLRHYLGKANKANRHDLWDAAIYHDLCYYSEDSFRYFGCWLIAQGRQVYEKALADPDSLANLPPADSYYLERIMSSAGDAWEEKTGEGWESLHAARQNAEETP